MSEISITRHVLVAYALDIFRGRYEKNDASYFGRHEPFCLRITESNIIINNIQTSTTSIIKRALFSIGDIVSFRNKKLQRHPRSSGPLELIYIDLIRSIFLPSV